MCVNFRDKTATKIDVRKRGQNVEESVIVNENIKDFGNQVSNQDWQGISVDDKKLKSAFNQKMCELI